LNRVVFGFFTSAFLFGANGAASAAPGPTGCSALSGQFVGDVVSGNTSATGFSAGDVVTLTVTTAGGFASISLTGSTSGSLLMPAKTVGSRTYTVPADTTETLTIGGVTDGIDAAASYSWSCTPGSGSTGGNTDSGKLDNVQEQGSTVVGQTSGANISGSVNGAIDNALNQPAPASSEPISSEPMGREEFADYYASSAWHVKSKESEAYREMYKLGLDEFDSQTKRGFVLYRASGGGYRPVWQPSTASQFSAEPRSNVSDRAEEAFAALGYAAVNKAPSRRAPEFVPQWSTWADVRGTGFEQSDSRVFKGTQVNATAGLNYKIRPNLVVGLFGGYENFDYEFASLTGRLKGDGGTVGTYAGWQITPTLRWKGMVGWTGLGYDASAGTAAGSFDGSRWLFSTGLTGSHRVASFILEPSADVFAIWERQTAYTDTLGVLHDARSFSSGRVSLGGKAIAPGQGLWGATPYLGLYGDWRFASNDAQPAAVPFAGIGEGWSARVTGGLNMRVFTTGSLALGAEYGGIGADYKLWTGNARLTLPF